MLVLASTYPRWRDDPEPGFVHELCRRLAEHFVVVALVPDAPGADPSGVFEGVEVVRYRYAPRRWQTLVNNGGIVTNLKRSAWKWLLVPGFVAGQYVAARKLLRARTFHVLHAHWLLPQGLIARSLARQARLPYLVTSHGGDLFGLQSRVLNALKRKVAVSAAAMTIVSSAMRDEARRIGLAPPSLEVLPMGVDLHERFIPSQDANHHRNGDELLFVGRLVPKKGLVHLIDALPAVLARRPATLLTIAGFGPEEENLRGQARRLGIADRVVFTGAMQQRALPDLYRRAALFVAPFVRDASGNQEGLPVVLMEAIGCGCPIVVGNVAGLGDLLGEALRDVCVDPADPNALAAAILAALDDPMTARTRAETLRRLAIGKVDWNIIAAAYTRVLSAVSRTQP
jgi:glycosyltransferase involved in cell wall biosynthesis